MVISPDGRFLYVAVTELEIEVFEIRAGGVLARDLCSTCHTEARPRALAIGPNGRFLYATNNNSGESSIPAFEIRPDGSLLPIHGCGKAYCPTAKAELPVGLAVSPSGRFVYASNVDNNQLSKPFEAGIVSAFDVGAGGELTSLECPTIDCALVRTPASTAW